MSVTERACEAVLEHLVPREQEEEARRSWSALKAVQLDEIAVSDLYQLGIGAFSPLDGFVSQEDYHSIVETMRLASGHIWSIPVTLPVSEDVARTLRLDEPVALVRPDGVVCGRMTIRHMYRPDRDHEAEQVYRTKDVEHPGVRRLYERGGVYLGGPVEVLPDERVDEFTPYAYTPRQTRAAFQERGWRTIVGFQTRNP
ncbi:MAG: sulfate adenylyltransferase, partial [Alicyclobacillus mali]|nr:sulfate adenylyltransferase [Alicyclobacillus mali (ex Roth et al. 2021)]